MASRHQTPLRRSRIRHVLAGVTLLVLVSSPARAALPSEEEPPLDTDFVATTTGDDAVLLRANGSRSSTTPGGVGPFLDVDSATGVTWAVDRPPSVPTGCTGQLLSGQWTQDACPLTATTPDTPPPDDPAFQPPTTADIIFQGLASTPIHPAGLTIQPTTRTYVSVPTLAHATTPHQHLTVTILGRTVPIDVNAQTYTFDFGDNTPPLTTTTPGAPYPDTTNHHTYLHPAPAVTITLTTTWSATATNPFTGQTLTINGIITTREQSPPLQVRAPTTTLTDLAEEHAGH